MILTGEIIARHDGLPGSGYVNFVQLNLKTEQKTPVICEFDSTMQLEADSSPVGKRVKVLGQFDAYSSEKGIRLGSCQFIYEPR